MSFLFSKDNAGCSMGDRLEGRSMGGRRSCLLRGDGGFDWTGVGVDGEKWGCFPCGLETESTSCGVQ